MHCIPSPVKPVEQMQVKFPTPFIQDAFEWQLSSSSMHSSTSRPVHYESRKKVHYLLNYVLYKKIIVIDLK